MNKNFSKAIEVLKNGGIVIFPTDTAFGIGCRIDDKKAIERLFEIRKRSRDKAVPVLARSIEMVESYVGQISPDVRNLMQRYWPGGLTLVLSCKIERIPSLVRGEGDTIGIRIPNHNDLLKVINKVGVPILGPSANFSGAKTPYKTSDLDPKLVSLVDFVLPGRCKIKKPSTVIDCSKKPWKILRLGAVDISNIK